MGPAMSSSTYMLFQVCTIKVFPAGVYFVLGD